MKWNTHPIPMIWLRVTSQLFPKIKSALKGRRFQDIEDIQNTALQAIPKQIKVKVKVKLSLCLTKHHAMKAYWGVEI
jgi:hypothetical protein